MQNIYPKSFEERMNILQKNLEEIECLEGRPCRIYSAYKIHMLVSGISELEISEEYLKTVNSLLIKYKNELQKIFSHSNQLL